MEECIVLISNYNMQDTIVYISLKKIWISIFKNKHITIRMMSLYFGTYICGF